MALYRLSNSIISRSRGGSALAAAAYRSGSVLQDDRLGVTHDYSQKSDVEWTAILAPDYAPSWVRDREQLWNHVEASEHRKDSQLARECLVALPKELGLEQNIHLLNQFAQQEFVSRGIVADIGLHNDENNPHAHILLTMRVLNENGFGLKNRNWNQKTWLRELRQSWAEHCNTALEVAGKTERVDHRSLKDQGIDRIPQIHLGSYAAKCLREGVDHPRVERYLEIENINRQRQSDNAQVALLEMQLQEEIEWQHEQAEMVLGVATDFFNTESDAGRIVERGKEASALCWNQYEFVLETNGIQQMFSVRADDRGELVSWVGGENGEGQNYLSSGLETQDVQTFEELRQLLKTQQQQQQWVDQIARIIAQALALNEEDEVSGKYTGRYDRANRVLKVSESATEETFLVAWWNGEQWQNQGSKVTQAQVDHFQDTILPRIQEIQHQQELEITRAHLLTAAKFFNWKAGQGQVTQLTSGEWEVRHDDYKLVNSSTSQNSYFALRAEGRGELARISKDAKGNEIIQLEPELSETDKKVFEHLKDWMEQPQRQAQQWEVGD